MALAEIVHASCGRVIPTHMRAEFDEGPGPGSPVGSPARRRPRARAGAPLLADLDALGVPLTAIVEHDLYPTPPDVPLPIATRTNRYYRGCGMSAART